MPQVVKSKKSIRVQIPILLKHSLDNILEHGDMSKLLTALLRQLVLLATTVGASEVREAIRTNRLRLTFTETEGYSKPKSEEEATTWEGS